MSDHKLSEPRLSHFLNDAGLLSFRDFAAALETQLAEAIRERDEWKEAAEHARARVISVDAQLKEALRERDDLKTELATAFRERDATVSDLVRERDEALAKVKREEDRAREFLTTREDWARKAVTAEAQRDALAKALRALFKLVEDGVLVRDTSHDHESDWAVKQIPLVLTLKESREALATLDQTASVDGGAK